MAQDPGDRLSGRAAPQGRFLVQIFDTSLARRVRRSPALRPAAVAAYRVADRMMPAAPGPRVVANSMPKSGTHLLGTLLDQVEGMRFNGRLVLFHQAHQGSPQAPLHELDRRLRTLRRSHYLGSHLICVPEVVDRVDAHDVKMITILRDPRAIVLSAAHYILAAPQLSRREQALAKFPDKDALLRATVFGVGEPGDDFYAPEIGERYASYAAWADSTVGITVRFEDMIGARGGGSSDRPVHEVERILAYLGLPVEPAAAIADNLFSDKVITFRSGAIDSWREELSSELLHEIEERCGETMERLGYLQ